MTCPFCSAANASVSAGVSAACRVCGGPLRGTIPPPLLRPKTGNAAATVALSPVQKPLAPIAPVAPVEVVPPAAAVLMATRDVNKKAARSIAILFCPAAANQALFVAENGALKLWDIQNDALHLLPTRRTLFSPGPTTSAAISPHGIVATCRESGQICLQLIEMSDAPGHAPGDGQIGWKSRVLHTFQAHRGRVWSLSLSGTRLLSAGSDGTVVLTVLPAAGDAAENRRAEGQKSQVILDGLGALCALSLSPDGRLLALGGDDGQVQMWQLKADGEAGGEADGTEARLDWTTRKTRAAVKSLQFSPNGHMLLSGDAQGRFNLRAAQSGHELQRLTPHSTALAPPAFAPDSRLLALVNAQNGIDLLDAWTGTLRHTLPPLRGEIQAIAFAPAKIGASETLLVAAAAQQICAWKVAL